MKIIAVVSNLWVLMPLILWALPWKGVALWKAARRRNIGWFIAILILNTLAILEIIYIFFISRKPQADIESLGENQPVKKKVI